MSDTADVQIDCQLPREHEGACREDVTAEDVIDAIINGRCGARRQVLGIIKA